MVPQTTNQVWFSFTPRASSPKCWTNGSTWCDVPINVQCFSTPLSASINFKCVLAYISINIYHLPFLFVVQYIISLLWFIISFFRSIISLFSRCDTPHSPRFSRAPVHWPSKSTRPRTPMLSLPRKWARGKVLKPTKIWIGGMINKLLGNMVFQSQFLRGSHSFF